MRPTAAGVAVLAIVLMVLPPTAGAQRAAVGPPDWPCVQRLIPNLSPGTLWSGPPIDQLETSWWSDAEIARVARFASARATTVDDAVERVAEFTRAAEGDRESRFTLLFAGLFELIGRERTRTIEAIRSYSRGQVRLLERIGARVDELEAARAGAQTDDARVAELEQEIFWDRRVFEERQASMRLLCEQPYRLEERLSRLVRVIEAAL